MLTAVQKSIVSTTPAIQPIPRVDPKRIHALVADVQGKSRPLAQCVADALGIARETQNTLLEAICIGELTGWDRQKVDAVGEARVHYRVVSVMFSPYGEVNIDFLGFRGNPQRIIQYMRADPEHFFEQRVLIPIPLAQLESYPTTGVNIFFLYLRCALATLTQQARSHICHCAHTLRQILCWILLNLLGE